MDSLSFAKKPNTKGRLLCEELGIPYSHFTHIGLPAGHSCVGAKYCKTFADPRTGVLTDRGDWRCYAASTEAYSPNYRAAVWHNWRKFQEAGIRNPDAMYGVIMESIPKRTIQVVRMMVGGDFITHEMMEAFVRSATAVPEVVWYGYSKHYWAMRMTKEDWPKNFRLTYSHGGIYDMDADFANWPQVYVVMKAEHMPELPLDTNDMLAYKAEGSFKLLLHGGQPPHVRRLTK